MKKITSVLGGILCFALLLGLLCLPVAADSEKWTDQLRIVMGEDVYKGYVFVKDKANTEVFKYHPDSKTYAISTSAGLAAVAKLVNTELEDGSYVTDFSGVNLNISNDIDLHEYLNVQNDYDWVPIGTPTNPFKGNIIGVDQYVLSHLVVTDDSAVATASARYYGLVGYSEGASVSNLTLDGTITVNGAAGKTDYVGAAIAYAKTGSTQRSEVSNVTSKVIMSASGEGTLKLGGIVGEANGAKLSGCANGGMEKSGSKDVYDGSSGTFTVNGTATASIGGLIGSVSAESVVVGNAGTATRNNAPLSVTATNADVGGIVGSVNDAVLYMTSESNATGTPATNTEFIWSLGNLTVQATTANVGGFIGSVTGAGKCDLKNAVFTRSLTVSGTHANVGGILGKQTGTGASTFTDCKYITRLRVENENHQVLLEEKNTKPTIHVTSTGTVYTGGIYGYADKLVLDTPTVGSHADATAEEYPIIQSTGNVGGVGGNTETGKAYINEKTATITTLTVQGDSENGHVGGVFGKSAGIDTLNLTVGKLTVTDTHAGASLGGVVGQGNGDFKNVNVTVGGNLTVTGGDSALAGGVAGGNTVVAHTVTLIASGPVSVTGGASSRVGGLFGSVNGSVTTLTLTANDTLTVTGGANSRLGGLVGEMTGNVTKLGLTAKKTLTITGGAQTTAGGVVGVQVGTAENVTLDAADQTVTVTATGDNGTLGGVFGSFSGASAKTVSLTAKTLSVTDAGTGCALGGAFGRFTGTAETVAATITDKLTVTAGANGALGGMAGAFSGTAKDWTVTVSNAGKTAKIAVTGSGIDTQLGGVFGTFTGTVTATGTSRNNFTADKIEVKDSSGTSSLGGFVGEITGASTLSLTEFAGAVSIDSINSDTFANKDNRIGTIAGVAENLTLETTELNVASVITAKGNSGALGGLFGTFNGTVDGSTLHVIGSIDLNHTGDGSHIGGFAGENSGALNNVNLGDRVFLRASEGSQCIIGGLVGVNTAAGKIDFCYTTAELHTEGKSSAFNKLYQSTVGGLVGSNAGTVLNSYRDIEVVMVSSKDDGAVSYVGGLIGSMSGGSVEKCYTSCDVDVSGVTNLGAYAGGLIGRLTGGTVKNCYTAEKTIKANTDYGTVGGFVGEMSGSETRIEQCYTAMHVDAGAYKGVFFGFYKEGTVKSCIRLVDNGKQINYNMEAAGRENLPVDLSEMIAKSTETLSDASALSKWTATDGIWRPGTLEGRANPYPELIRTPADNKVTLNYDLRWYTVDPDQNSYTLSDEADLAGLTFLVNGGFMGINYYAPLSFAGKTLTISDPINIQTDKWIQIGTGRAYFAGTLDGNQKIITGLTADGGLFTTLVSGAVLKDVWLETLGITGPGNVGALARENKASVSDPIIYVHGDITTTGGSAGGVCGVNNGGSISGPTVYVKYSITGTANAGGVAGDSTGAITKPTVELDTTITASADGSHAGGVTGTFPAGKTMSDVSLTFGKDAAIQAKSHAGGVIGKNSGTINGLTFIYTEDGNVSIKATGNGSYAGGVAGENDTAAIALTCADIEVKDSVTAKGYAGGLAGKSQGKLKIGKLTVNAPILASGDNSYAGGAVGEVVGETAGGKVVGIEYTTLELNGAVTSMGYAGGLAGKSNGAISGVNVTLNEEISATYSVLGDTSIKYAGGIAGYCGKSITCETLNVGKAVSAAGNGSFAGGVAGKVDGETVDGKVVGITYTTLELNGAVTSTGYAGGLAGKCGGTISGGSVTLKEAISATGEKGNYAGGIAGQSSGAITCETLTVKQPITASGTASYAGGAAGDVTGNVTVDNLVLDGAVTATSHAGGLAGKCVGTITSKTLTATANGTIDATGATSYAGGAVGEITGGVTYTTMTLDAAVTAKACAGGLAGKCGGTISGGNVTLNEAISATGDTGKKYAGGIAGQCSKSITCGILTVGKSISAEGVESYAGGAVGEVVGEAINEVTVGIKYTTLELNGTVTSMGYAGGIAGKSGGTISGGSVTLKEAISATGEKGNYAGGIAGQSSGAITCETLTVKQPITAYGTAGYAGGAAGDVTGNVTFDNLVLDGAVTATSHAGGLAGKCGGSITSKSLTVIQPITASGDGSFAGGAVGEITGGVTYTTLTLDAAVTAKACAGGLAGQCGGAISEGTMALNGAVSAIGANSYAGGVAGKSTGTIGATTLTLNAPISTVGASSYAGGIAGYADGALSGMNVVIDADISGTGASTYAGGLAGYCGGSIDSSRVILAENSAGVNISGVAYVGGLAGQIKSGANSVSDCVVSGVKITGSEKTGGLVGKHLSTAECAAAYVVSSDVTVVSAVNGPVTFTGGVFGVASGNMTNVEVENLTLNAAQTGDGNVFAGDVAGKVENGLLEKLRVSTAAMKIESASADIYAGGLFGSLSSTLNTQGVDDATLTGLTLAVNPDAADVGTKNAFVGGLVGKMDKGRVFNSSVIGSVNVLGFDQVAVGGMLGQADDVQLVNDRASGCQLTVNNAKEYRVGGVVGKAENVKARFCSAVSELPITVEQNANGASYQYLYIGGFVGDLISCTVSESFSSQAVIVNSEFGGTNIHAGGFAGRISRISGTDPAVSACYALESCSIDGIARGYAGGFVGRQEAGTIEECYASGKIIRVTTDYAYCGGFAGDQNAGTIRNCYSVNDSVTSQGEYNSYVGAIAGRQSGTIATSYGETGSIYTSLGETPAKTVIIPATEQKLNEGKHLTDFDFESADAKWCYIPGLNKDRPVLTALESWDAWPDLDMMRNHQGTVFTVADAVQFGTVVRMMHDQELCTLLGITTPVTVTSIELTNDIDLNGKLWTPINELPVNAVLDGGNHTVSGMRGGTTAYEGYGLVKLNSGTIRNLKLSGSVVDSGSPAGIVTGTNKGSITDITISDSSLTGTGKAGTIAGVNEKNALITKCSIAADTTVKGPNVGGIAGENLSTISDSVTNAKILPVDPKNDLNSTRGGAVSANEGILSKITSGATVEGAIAGGVAGVNRAKGTITDTVRSSADVSGSVAAGGVVGRNLGTVGTEGKENDVVTEATVRATASAAVAGGIAGENDGGTMIGLRAEAGTSVTGLVAGGLSGTNKGTGSISASSTSADVRTSNADNSNAAVGGAVGTNAATLKTITSDASVNGAVAGGVAGINQAGGTISDDILSRANVTGSVAAGGIVGRNLGTVGTAADKLADVVSYATVEAPTVGGIAGSSSGTLQNSDYLADKDQIKGGATAKGGVVGTGTYNADNCHGGTCEQPVASPGNHYFNDTIKVSLTTNETGVSIYYGLGENTEPTVLYTGEIELKETTTINAKAVAPGMYDSPLLNVTYYYAGGSSSGGGGGGSSSGETETKPNTVEIPVSAGDESIALTAEIEGGMATVLDAELDEVLEAEDFEAISFDIGETQENISELVIPADMVNQIAEAAADESNDIKCLEIALPAGIVKLDSSALEKASETGEDITVSMMQNADGSTTVALSSAGKPVAAQLKIELPDVEEGQVLVLVKADGSEEIVKKSLIEDGKAYALIEAGATVKVSDAAIKFPDVAEGKWFSEAVDFVSSHGLFQGTNNGFEPARHMNRAMLATVLYRLEDAAASGTNPFDDVADGSWYADAVIWANANGIVQGTGTGFHPMQNVTREQIATMLFRYAKLLGLDTSGSAALDMFPDGSETADWSREAMQWAVSVKLFQGNADGSLNPKGEATRAEVAALMQRMIALIVK